MLNRFAYSYSGMRGGDSKDKTNTAPGKLDFSHISQVDKRNNLEGLNYFRGKNYQMALEKFKAAAKSNPKEAEYPNNMAMSYYWMGQYTAAIPLLKQAISLKPLSLYHFNLGLVYLGARKPAESLSEMENAIKLNPKNFAAWSHKALLLYNTGKDAEAGKAWEAAAKLKDDPEVENNLGMLQLKAGNLDAALNKFDKAVSINANYALAHFNRGVVLQKKSKNKEAASAYQRSIDQAPKRFQSYLNLAIVNQKMGNKAQAIQNLENFLKHCPPQYKKQIVDAKKRLNNLQKQA